MRAKSSEEHFADEIGFARNMRIKVKPLYRKMAYEGRFVWHDSLRGTPKPAKALGISMSMQIGENEEICVLEKYIKRIYDRVFIETHSCTTARPSTPGWIEDSIADFIIFWFCPTVDGEHEPARGIICKLPTLREWFFANRNNKKIKMNYHRDNVGTCADGYTVYRGDLINAGVGYHEIEIRDILNGSQPPPALR